MRLSGFKQETLSKEKKEKRGRGYFIPRPKRKEKRDGKEDKVDVGRS